MGLVGWDNYGEQFLAKTVDYLVGEQYETKPIDFRPFQLRFRYLIYAGMVAITNLFPGKHKPYPLILFGVKLWTKRYYRKQLKDCDALIFACGSYKYGTQKLWAHYAVAIDTAQKLGIPVMFNAMNVQKYNGTDWRCRCLTHYSNYPCVKMFTTRDGEVGVKRLKKDYLKNEHVPVIAVGDAAFWIPECYNVQRKQEHDVIGINLIRGDVFADYGYSVTEMQLADLYCDLLKLLDEKELKWELFTNGLDVDYKFGQTVLKQYGKEDISIRVPNSDRDLVLMISGYKSVVGSRLHACICAYSLNVPFVGFIWDEKLVRFSEIIDRKDYFVSEDQMQAELLYEKLVAACENECDSELRTRWKMLTKKTIRQFLTHAGTVEKE